MHGICSPRLLLFCIYFGVFCIYFGITYFFLKNAFPTISIIFNLVEIWNKSFKIYCITVRAVIKRRATETVMTNQQVLAEQLGKISGVQLACSKKSLSQYPLCAPVKESTSTFYKHCSDTLFFFSSSKQQAGNSFFSLTAVLVLLIKSLHFHQFKQDSW